MKAKKTLVRALLLNMLTAGIVATAFTSCSDDTYVNKADAPQTDIVADENMKVEKAVGLVYEDFIEPNDVQILTADTTTITVSKAYADKLGITNFVNHPLGIWQSYEERPYMRRPVSQRLVGDRYVLNVVPSGIGEVFQGQAVELNTSIFVNPEASTRGGNGAADKYTDENNVIHPVAVSLCRRPGETRGSYGKYGTLSAEQILAGENFNEEDTRNIFEDIGETIIKFITEGGRFHGSSKGKALEMSGKINPPEIGITREANSKKDTVLSINTAIPFEIVIDYTLKIDTKVTPKILPPFLDVDTKYFEGRLDGNFKMNPELLFSVSAKAEIPKEKQDYTLADLGEFYFVFMAGTVPVAIVVQPQLVGHFNLGVEGEISSGFNYEYESQFSVGMKYVNKDWLGIAEHEVKKSKFNFVTPRGSMNVFAEAGILLACNVLIDGVVGPTASFGPMLKGNLTETLAPFEKNPFEFETSLKLGLTAKAGATLKLWKIPLGEWTLDLNLGPQLKIWDYKFPNDNDNDKSEAAQSVKEMAKEIQAESEALKAQREAEKARIAAETQRVWNNFVNYVQTDAQWQRDIRLFQQQANYTYYRKNLKAPNIGEKALQQTYKTMMNKSGKICQSDWDELQSVFRDLLNLYSRRPLK